MKLSKLCKEVLVVAEDLRPPRRVLARDPRRALAKGPERVLARVPRRDLRLIVEVPADPRPARLDLRRDLAEERRLLPLKKRWQLLLAEDAVPRRVPKRDQRRDPRLPAERPPRNKT